MSSEVDAVRQFGERAPRYENAAHRWQAARAVAHAALRPGQRVLDIATGTGLAAEAAAVIVGQDGEVIGVDASPGMVAEAQAAGHDRCRYIVGDGVDLPAGLGSFDRLLCVAGLPYLGDPVVALTRWQAVCRPAARILVSVPAERGILAFAILQDAAEQEGLELATPNAGIGTAEGLASVTRRVSLRVEARIVEIFDDGPLNDDAGAVFRSYVELGHAPTLVAAPADQREQIRARFVAAYNRAAGTSSLQHVVYARLVNDCV